ncbi:ankyrin repeat domain-containing protein [Endozoicomonas acroporae]|uniref:ankyrin repeat domain-containing protein n=1 Tax=Endozoicomonas acroporae TaxID=1701104 RepID=UPI000C7627D9
MCSSPDLTPDAVKLRLFRHAHHSGSVFNCPKHNGPRNIRTKLTPLHYAAEEGQLEAIDALIAKSADTAEVGKQ